MISFACICGERISVPEDQAGGMIQCPKCGRLLDIPNLSEIKQLNDDGTYVLDDRPVAEDPNRFQSLTRAFTRNRFDEFGNEIDIRQNPQAAVPDDDREPLELVDDPTPSTARVIPPRYDPVTGELIRPIDVRPDATESPDIPMAKAVLAYAAPQVAGGAMMSGLQMLAELFRPINMAVVFFVFLMHAFLTFAIFISLLVILPIVGAICGIMICLGHWSIVVESMGPDELDELPRPLRNFAFGEDIWSPFCHTFFSLGLCLVPSILAWQRGAGGKFFSVVLLLTGIAFFPAVLLTMCTSRSVANLRPDRLIGVMVACGTDYLFAIFAGAGALLGYFGALGLITALYDNIARTVGVPHLKGLFASYPGMFVALLGMHAFCWYLGLLYRRHHAKFPWAFQRHLRTRPPVQRRKPVYVSPTPPSPPPALSGGQAIAQGREFDGRL